MRRLLILLVMATLLGSAFRLTNLKGKVYWHDEVHTAMYVTGHGDAQVIETLFDGAPKSIADVMKAQTATAQKGPVETARRLAAQDAQHPPLYYVLCRLMLYVVPDTVLATRLVAAIAGILLIPATYILTYQLFSSSLSATLSTVLVAVSPFQYLYAQEARQYSLWALCIVVSSIAYLVALRRKSRLSWAIYSFTLFTSLCTFLLSLLIIISHGLHLLWHAVFSSSAPRKSTQRRILLTHFALSAGVSLLLFMPWVQRISSAHIGKTSWTAQPIPLEAMAERWVNNLTRLFFDFNLEPPTHYENALSYQTLPQLTVVIFLLYVLIWSAQYLDASTKVFLLSLGGVTLVTFVAPDLLFGGLRSTIPRYLMPTYLTVQIACAHCLGTQLAKRHYSLPWKLLTAVILLAGALSCTASLPADVWWHKASSNENVAIANTLNRSPHALIVSSDYDINLGEILSICHRLKGEQSFLLFQADEAPSLLSHLQTHISTHPGKTFVFNLSEQSKAKLTASGGYQLTPTAPSEKLWQLMATK